MSCFFKQQLPRVLWLTGSFCLCSLSTTSQAQSQTIPDSTLPNNTVATPNGNISIIEGGTRAGSNLFHSFQEFSVPTGQEAYFNNALDIQNILSRVTGRNISNIDGTLRANGTANLFVINPNGIIFGPNAQLNIGGSFIGSTASSIKFADGIEFTATNPSAPPLLSINVPIGLQLGQNPGNIVNQSQAGSRAGLQVLPGQTLALVGGNVILDGGNLTASQGQIELGSVASAGLVSFTPTNIGGVGGFVLGYEGIENFGNIKLSGAATVNTSGLGGGSIRVRGGQVELTEGSKLVAETFGNLNGEGIDIQATQFDLKDKAFVSTSTFGLGAGGSLAVRAGTVELIGTEPLETSRQLIARTFNPFNLKDGLFSLSGGSGAAGNLTIDAGQLIMKDGANVLTTALLDGVGGNLTVKVSELAELSNGSILVTGTAGSGDAGNLAITAKQLKVLDGTALSTTPGNLSTGRGGNLTVTAESVELRGTPAGAAVPGGLFTTSLGAGDAGDLSVATTGQLIVAEGAQISAASAGGGRGGNLTVTGDSVELSGISADGRFLGGVYTSSSLLTLSGQQGSASAGELKVTSRRLSVRDGAQISAATGSQGSAGNLSIRASESVTVSGFATSVDPLVESVSFGIIGDGIVPSAIEANTSGAGGAGDLNIETKRLTVRDGAEIGVRATSSGAAGNLDVKADSILLDNPGAISAATITGTGGNIRLQASDIQLRRNSQISTNTSNSDGGNITIDTDILVALENSDITANAQQGRGGRVSITAQGVFGTEFRDKLTPESDITATSNLGAQFNGIVTINIQGIDLNRGLVQLPENFTDSSRQIVTGCAADKGNRFVVIGRGGLPEDPSQTLRGRTVWQDLRPLEEREGEGERGRGGERENSSTQTQNGARNFTLSQGHPFTSSLQKPNSQTPIVEATGWVINAKGQVELVTQAPQLTPQTPWSTPTDCHILNSRFE